LVSSELFFILAVAPPSASFRRYIPFINAHTPLGLDFYSLLLSFTNAQSPLGSYYLLKRRWASYTGGEPTRPGSEWAARDSGKDYWFTLLLIDFIFISFYS
jgi:hypothetical protein